MTAGQKPLLGHVVENVQDAAVGADEDGPCGDVAGQSLAVGEIVAVVQETEDDAEFALVLRVFVKDGQHDYATRVMQVATRDFEDLTEPDDWSVAHQKLALARRGAGDLTRALHFIDIARSSGTPDSPMQRVRLDTAHGHILLSDAATRDDGLLVLDQAAKVAAQYGLVHQLRSIESIKAMGESPASPRTSGARPS